MRIVPLVDHFWWIVERVLYVYEYRVIRRGEEMLGENLFELYVKIGAWFFEPRDVYQISSRSVSPSKEKKGKEKNISNSGEVRFVFVVYCDRKRKYVGSKGDSNYRCFCFVVCKGKWEWVCINFDASSSKLLIYLSRYDRLSRKNRAINFVNFYYIRIANNLSILPNFDIVIRYIVRKFKVYWNFIVERCHHRYSSHASNVL